MDLEALHAALPPHLRSASATLAPLGRGMSGAPVYRVDAGGESFVLKLGSPGEPLAEWQRRLRIHERAAAAGVAAQIVHTDEAHRSVLTPFIADRSFPMLLMTPATRDSALALLGRTLRQVHDLAIPDDAVPADPHALLTRVSAQLAAIPAPAFVREAIAQTLADGVPASGRPRVLSHNDVNPANLVYDGERIVLLDWDTAAPNDPLYDLATVALFLRMDDDASAKLIAAHDGVTLAPVPEAFRRWRRYVGVMCGALFLTLARQAGHAGPADETPDTALSLGDFFMKMRTGAINIGTSDGKWQFGLALAKAALRE